MCGISGIVSKSGLASKALLLAMNQVIAHRGPDGEGFYLNDSVGLGHRRLAIIDTSSAGSQPMSDSNGSVVIVYNGEIYNYRELKEELVKLGCVFSSATDTEVILKSYIVWGKDCVNRFNGMWSFCLHDSVNNILFCSRDRFGVKPFYYFNDAKNFAFGSEIKQLLSLASPSTNRSVLADFLVLGFEEHTEETFFKGIYKLKPGHSLVYNLSTNKFVQECYFELKGNDAYSNLSLQDSAEMIRETFIDSVRLRLRSDVEVGTCLSGGLDSSSIAAIASKELGLGLNFKAFHAKSSDSYNDESQFARMVANNCGIRLIESEPSYDFFIDSMKLMASIQEEPFGGPSIFMQYAVFNSAKLASLKVMLDGQGGDETFLGYERYFSAILNRKSLLNRVPAAINYSRKSRLSLKDVLAHYIYFTTASPRIRKLKRRAGSLSSELLSFTRFDLINEMTRSYEDPIELQKLELTKFQLPHLLKYEDKNSMANSIESRLPFLDYRLVQQAISINPEQKIHDGWSKYVLRYAMSEYLPKEIVWRKFKRGFESPRTWLLDPSVMDKSIQESSICRRIFLGDLSQISTKLKWKLYSVALWESEYDVNY